MSAPIVTVSGTTEPGALVSVNGVLAMVEDDGSFSCQVALEEGSNTITVTAIDAAGNDATVSRTVVYDNPLSGMIDELAEELSEANEALGAALDELNATNEGLGAALDELSGLRDELSAVKDDLNAVEEDLADANEALDAVKSQNLMLTAALAVFAALAVVMTVMYLGLRKRVTEMGGEPSREPPPPPEA